MPVGYPGTSWASIKSDEDSGSANQTLRRVDPRPLVESLTKEDRVRIAYAMRDGVPSQLAAPPPRALYEIPGWPEVGLELCESLKRAWGRANILSDMSVQRAREIGLGPHQDVSNYLINQATNDEVRDMIEEWFVAVDRSLSTSPAAGIAASCHERFRAEVNSILDSAGSAYTIQGRARQVRGHGAYRKRASGSGDRSADS